MRPETVWVCRVIHAESVADHSRHRVQRLQNCVVRRLSFLFLAPTYRYVLLNGDDGDQCWQRSDIAARNFVNDFRIMSLKCFLRDAKFYLWNAWNSISAGAPSQTLLGELTALSMISSWIFWRRGGEREMGRGKVKGREWRRVEEREEGKGREKHCVFSLHSRNYAQINT